MNSKLFVGNVPFRLSETDLQQLFSQSGKVVSVALPTDRDTGRKRGFAFVEMETLADAENAIQQLHGQVVEGRELVVAPAKPKERTLSQ